MITIMIMVILLPKSKKYQIQKLENAFIYAKWKKWSYFLCFSAYLISFPSSGKCFSIAFISTKYKKSSNFLHFLICIYIYIYIYILCYIYIYYVIYIYILHIYIIYYLFIITKWIMFYQCYLFTPDGKTLMIYITFRNCTVSVFPQSGKNEVILCIYFYI